MAYIGRIIQSPGALPFQANAADGSFLGAFASFGEAQRPFQAQRAGRVKFTPTTFDADGAIPAWTVEDF